MSIYIDADAIIRWERGDFDLPGWLSDRPADTMAIPATVWQQLQFGVFAWSPERAAKLQQIGFADFQIAAASLEDGAELLTFNRAHFSRVPSLRLASV